MARVSA